MSLKEGLVMRRFLFPHELAEHPLYGMSTVSDKEDFNNRLGLKWESSIPSIGRARPHLPI